MATNTCASEITYNSIEDMQSEPFQQIRMDKAQTMFSEGKAEYYPNILNPGENPNNRGWVDHAAAQEFIDFVVAQAPTYNIPIVAANIVDY
jgi:hypothetical protein